MSYRRAALSDCRTPVALLLLLMLTLCGVGHAQDQKDREFRECPNCPEMVGIPAGKFVMGSPESEPGRFDSEGPRHVVAIKAFALGKYDITSEQFLAFLESTGYQPAPCNRILDMQWHLPAPGVAYPPAPTNTEPPKWPAICLDWHDADAYIAWLNSKVKRLRPILAHTKGPYRLPTEAEWEYAARAGTTTARWWGNPIGTGNANCDGCGSKWDNVLLDEVDSFKPNPFGLYGVLGNVWQWTADCWHPNYVGAPRDGRPWTDRDCAKHVIRGGSWGNVPIFVRSATRSAGAINDGSYDDSSYAGFRVARDLP